MQRSFESRKDFSGKITTKVKHASAGNCPNSEHQANVLWLMGGGPPYLPNRLVLGFGRSDSLTQFEIITQLVRRLKTI
jgi:hypothetical protein